MKRSLRQTYITIGIVMVLILSLIAGFGWQSFFRWQSSERMSAYSRDMVMMTNELMMLGSESIINEQIVEQWRATVSSLARNLDNMISPHTQTKITKTRQLLGWVDEIFTQIVNTRTLHEASIYRDALSTLILDLTSTVQGLHIDYAVTSRQSAALHTFQIMNLSILVLACFLAVVGFHLYKRLLKPLERLTSSIRQYGFGQRDSRASRSEIAELDMLAGSFNDAADRINHITHDLEEEIVERKRFQEVLRENEISLLDALQEKEALLREIHHRVKNNISSIANLLYLQAETATQPETVSLLQDALSRVYSMKELYEKMLVKSEFQTVGTHEYLSDLIDSILKLFDPEGVIEVKKDLQPFTLSSKHLFPLGLIVNELLTNSLKYAFSKDHKGSLQIATSCTDGLVRLIVQDNGKGFPRGFDIDQSEGFGLMLVKMLSKQLGGRFQIKSDHGAWCMLEFGDQSL